MSTNLFPLGKGQCLFFPVSFSSRIEHGALPISLNEESIRVDTATMFSFWTPPVYESGVPRRKEQLLDQWRKWKGFYVNQVPVAIIDSLIKAIGNAARQGSVSASHMPTGYKWVVFGCLGWIPKLMTQEEWEISEEPSIHLFGKLNGCLYYLGETLY